MYEWADRQIKPLVIIKKQMTQELDMGVDTQVKLACDNAVPDGTKYSAHTAHITTDSSAAFSLDRFKATGRFLRHAPTHRGPKGIALMGPSAVDGAGELGTDDLKPETVEMLTRKGLSQYDPSVVLGLEIDGWSLVEDPLEADASLKTRFYSRPEYVGYYIPVLFQVRL